MSWKPGEPTRIAAGGKSLEARMIGPAPGEAPTIVMLHEGLGSVGLWRDFPDRVAAATGCGVLAYSRAGYGRSDGDPAPWPVDYMTRHALDVLPDVLDAVGAQGVIFLGHSDGATIAAIHAGSVQDRRVRGLVLMAPHFFIEDIGVASIAAARKAYEEGGLKPRMARHHDNPDDAFHGWNSGWLRPEFRDWSVEEVIAYIRVPVLAIQGVNDEYGTLAQIEALEKGLYSPLDKVILPDCGHSPHIDRPERVLAEITEFAARLRRIEAAIPRVA